MCRNCKKPYYITTAIAYTSGKPHIGNTYEIVLADSIARYKREQGFDVRFQTGTDEHGQKIELKAEEAGVTPQEFVDGVAAQIKSIWDLMNTSYDKFIRTTDKEHEEQVQKIFKKLYDKGDIYKGHYEGLYCTPCESFWTSSQVTDGKCPDCGRPVVPAKEEAYFFKMSKYAQQLIDHINEHPEFIQPVSRKNEMMNNFLLPGLQDLCVSRTSFKWGIPVDFDPKHVTYVWLDALTNYITGIGYDCDGNSTEQFHKLWPADLHLIGKDIIRFHTIYWPIFLMALDLPLPKQVFGHPWLLQGDGKMSKSKGNVLYADELVDFFGVDAVRYFVLHEMPFENDGVISWELMVERLNSDLANTLGNLVNRTVSMTNKYFGGTVEDKGVVEDVDAELKKPCKSKTGDIWHLGKHTVICGDSTLPETFNALLGDTRVNLVCTDAPYFVDLNSTSGKIKNDNLNDKEAYEFLMKVFKNLHEYMQRDASFYEFYATSKARIFHDAFEDAGFKVGAGLVWKKDRLVLTRTDWKYIHEPIIFGWKKDGKHNWYGDQKQVTVFEFDRIKNSKEDGCVTVRDRDTMEQTRIPVSGLVKYIEERLEF